MFLARILAYLSQFASEMSKRKAKYSLARPKSKKQRAINNQLKALVSEAVNARTGGLVGIEKKWKEWICDDQGPSEENTQGELAWTGITDNVNYYSLTAVDQGSDSHQREGSQITLDGLYIKGMVYTMVQSVSSIYVPQTLRVIVVVDHQNNNSSRPGIENILDTSGNTIPTPDYGPVFCYRNLEQLQRFTILHDETFPLNAWDSGQIHSTYKYTNAKQHPINIQLKKSVKGLKINYTSTTASDSNQSSNAIFTYFLVDDNSVASTTPSVYFRGRARLRYYG